MYMYVVCIYIYIHAYILLCYKSTNMSCMTCTYLLHMFSCLINLDVYCWISIMCRPYIKNQPMTMPGQWGGGSQTASACGGRSLFGCGGQGGQGAGAETGMKSEISEKFPFWKRTTPRYRFWNMLHVAFKWSQMKRNSFHKLQTC